MNEGESWLQEARLRLEDALLLLENGRNARSVSAAYYAVHAAGKALLLAHDIELYRHGGLPAQLSLHFFVREGRLPGDIASGIDDLYDERLSADYELKSFSDDEARDLIDTAQQYVERMSALV